MDKPNIQIIAVGSNAEKGRALESAVGAVWSRLGFRKLRYNARVTGEEIDVEGTHVVSDEILKGQCKAHADRLDAAPVRLFFGDVEKERGAKQSRLSGVLISLAGFTGTVEKWYEELSEEQRAHFKLQDGPGFAAHLEEAGLIIDAEELVRKLHELSKLSVAKLKLILSERGVFWLVIFGNASTLTAYYCLLTGRGEKPRQEEVEHLLPRLPEKELLPTRVTLGGREAVVMTLLTHGTMSEQQIAKEAVDSLEDIRAAIDSLQNEQIVTIVNAQVLLRREIDALLAVSKIAFASRRELDLLKSSYFRNAITSVLIPFIEAKFCVRFSEVESRIVEHILLLSPRAVRYASTGDAQSYRTTEEHIRELKMSAEAADEVREAKRRTFIERIVHELMVNTEEGGVTVLFAAHDIVLKKVSIDLRIATRKQAFIDVRSSGYTMFAKAGSTIKAGQLVSTDGPGVMLECADATMAIGEWDDAIKLYDRVIDAWTGSEDAAAAKNNKGVCLLSKGLVDPALELFETVPQNDFARLQALCNLARCYGHKGNRRMAEQLLLQLAIEFPNYEDRARLDSDVLDLLKRFEPAIPPPPPTT